MLNFQNLGDFVLLEHRIALCAALDDPIFNRTDLFDFASDDIPGLQVCLRRHGVADTLWRSGQHDVAWLKLDAQAQWPAELAVKVPQ